MNKIVFDLSVADTNNFKISPIDRALAIAESRKLQITESLKTIKVIKPECDELDYALAAASGALCGIIDIFLVGIPKKSVLGSISDKWFADKTKAFAKLCGWKGNDKLSSAILFLEKNFKVSYDQNGLGVSTSEVYDLYPSNHHFKSLGHNPTLLGLFFSILDQYTNSSDFVSVGNHISVKNTSAVPELKGENIVQKIFFAFVNWIGHLMSDASGSSSGKGRGTGIPSPLLCWTNDIIVLKSKLGLSHTDFINQIAWLGGGTLAAGGSGILGGGLLLGMAGPVGWAIAAVALAGGGIGIIKNVADKKRLEYIFDEINVRNTYSLNLANAEIEFRIGKLKEDHTSLNKAIEDVRSLGTDYKSMKRPEKAMLATNLNMFKISQHLLTDPIEGLKPVYTEIDLNKFMNNCSQSDLDVCQSGKKSDYIIGRHLI